MAATPNNKRLKRPMPHGRQGNESFRYRSAISLDDVSTSAPSQRKGTLSDFSSLGIVDENNQVISSITSSIKSAAAGGRATALKLLHQAASVGIITNDLKPRRDTLDGMDEYLGDVILSEEGEEEEEDDEEENNKEEIRISRLSRSTKSINTEHKRNCGQHTIIAFVNSASGGGMGTTLYKSLQSHLGSEFVFDLHSCSPGNMPEDTLLEYAYDPNVRVLACGGDGTCGWLFSSLDNVWSIVLQTSSNRRVHLSQYRDHLSLAIMPLGTGNDLSRQFGWGGSFKSQMNDKSMIASVSESKASTLDRWRCIIMPVNTFAEDEKEYIPQILSENYHDIYPSGEGGEEEIEEEYPRRSTVATVELLQSLMNDDDDKESKSTTKSSRRRRKNQQLLSTASSLSAQVFDGVFCNYFSLGFDAAIAYLFHHDREQHPEKFTSPIKNKIIYASKAPYAFRAPKLSKRVKILVNNDKGELVKLKIPKSTRAIVLLNIQSIYAGHRLSSKGDPRDALIEVIFVSNLIRSASACSLSSVMPFLLFNVAAQTDNVVLRTKCPLHCQIDGEPWLQDDGVIQVKFHSRNSILEKKQDIGGINCGCMGGGSADTQKEDVAVN